MCQLKTSLLPSLTAALFQKITEGKISLKATVQRERQVSGRHSSIRERPERYNLENWSGTCLEVQKLPDPTLGCACIAVGTVDNGHQRQTSQHPDSVPGPNPKCGSQQSLEAILATTWKLSQQAATSWELPSLYSTPATFFHLWCAPYAEYFRLIQQCLGCRQGFGREQKRRKHDRKAAIIHHAWWTVMAPNTHLMLFYLKSGASAFPLHMWPHCILSCLCLWCLCLLCLWSLLPGKPVQCNVFKHLMHYERQEKKLGLGYIFGKRMWRSVNKCCSSTQFLCLPFSCWVACCLTKQQHFWDLKWCQWA